MLKSGLGRGLSSLIPDKLNTRADGFVEEAIVLGLPEERVRQIKVEKIEANPWQPREYFDHAQLEELVDSIKQHGILQPLIVSPAEGGNYQLIAGERRLKAAKVLAMATVPCLVRDAQKLEKLELALIENIQRADLNPVEEAKAYRKLIEEFNLTQEEVGVKVGKKRATITNALRLLDLPEEMLQALREGRLTPGHAKLILSAETKGNRLKIFKKILELDLTVRQTEEEVKKTKPRPLTDRDLEIEAKEDLLRRALNTRVKIIKKGKAGSIAIDFFSPEELAELVRKIAG